MSDSAHIYRVTLQVLQRTSVAAVDLPVVVQNSQKNDSTSVKNTSCISNVVEVANHSNY